MVYLHILAVVAAAALALSITAYVRIDKALD
jgi:hypothetical protein